MQWRSESHTQVCLHSFRFREIQGEQRQWVLGWIVSSSGEDDGQLAFGLVSRYSHDHECYSNVGERRKCILYAWLGTRDLWVGEVSVDGAAVQGRIMIWRDRLAKWSDLAPMVTIVPFLEIVCCPIF